MGHRLVANQPEKEKRHGARPEAAVRCCKLLSSVMQSFEKKNDYIKLIMQLKKLTNCQQYIICN
jgi:hypothetical protein